MQAKQKEERRESVCVPGRGLAAWIIAWFQTSLRVRISGIGKARLKARMELVEMLQLGGKRQLMLVLCDGQRYLVGAGGDSIHSIASLSPLVVPDTTFAAIDREQAEDGFVAAMQVLKQEIPCNS
jgi:flagellar biogenesis protein FliO